MNRRADSFFTQSVNELVAGDLKMIQIQLDHVQMPGVLCIRPAHWSVNFFQICKTRVVYFRDLFSGLAEFVALLQLFDSDGGGDIG